MASQIDIYDYKDLQFGKLSNDYPWTFRLGKHKEGNKWVSRVWGTITNYVYSNMIIGRSGVKASLAHVSPSNIHKEYKLALNDALRDEYNHILGNLRNIIEFNTETDNQAKLLISTNGPIIYASDDPILGINNGIGHNVYGECLQKARIRLKELQKAREFQGANEALKRAFQYFKACKIAKDNIKAGDFTLELYKKYKGIKGDVMTDPLLLLKDTENISVSAVWEASDFSMFKELYLKENSDIANYVDFYMANPTLLVPTIQAIYADDAIMSSEATFKRCLQLADARNKIKANLVTTNPTVSDKEVDDALMQMANMLYNIETDDPNLIQARKDAYISQEHLYNKWLNGEITIPVEAMCINPVSQQDKDTVTQVVESSLQQANKPLASLKLDIDITGQNLSQLPNNSPVVIGRDSIYDSLLPQNIRVRLSNLDFNNLSYVFYAIKFTLLPTSSRQFEQYFNSPMVGLPLSLSSVRSMLLNTAGTKFKTIPELQVVYQTEYDRFQRTYRIRLAQQALNLKFNVPMFAEVLKTTGSDNIVWGDRQDSILGIGPDGSGENWVGNYLMILRKNISDEINPTTLTLGNLSTVLDNNNTIYMWATSYLKDIINAYFVTTFCVQNQNARLPPLKYAKLVADSFFCRGLSVNTLPDMPLSINNYIAGLVNMYKQKARDVPKSVINVAWEFVVSALMTWENESVIDITSFIGEARRDMSKEVAYTPIIQGEFENSILISLIAIMKKLNELKVKLNGTVNWVRLIISATSMIIRQITPVSLTEVSDQDIQLEDSDKCDCPNCKNVRRQGLNLNIRPETASSGQSHASRVISDFPSEFGEGGSYQDEFGGDDNDEWAFSGSDNGRRRKVDNGIRCADVEKISQSLISNQIVGPEDVIEMTTFVRRAISYIIKYKLPRRLKRIRINYFTGTIGVKE